MSPCNVLLELRTLWGNFFHATYPQWHHLIKIFKNKYDYLLKIIFLVCSWLLNLIILVQSKDLSVSSKLSLQ